ncbi:putative CDC50/LEM3 family protein [Helianthus anomalus]
MMKLQLGSLPSMVTQQELPACKPILTPKWVVEFIDRYDNACLQGTKSQKVQSIQDPTTSKTCIRRLTGRSDQQLRNRGDENETSTCKPEHEAYGVYSTDNNLMWLLGSIQLITTCSWRQLLNFINCSQSNGVLQSRKSYNLVPYLAFSSS